MNLESNVAKFIRIEEGPALGSGKLALADDQLYTGLAHLFAIVIWPWKRKLSPAVEAHGKEALNMAITWFIAMLPLNIALRFVPNFLVSIVALVLGLVGLVALGLAIYGLLLARKGKLLRYPLNLRLIK